MPWECEACTWRNDESNADCSMCQTKRPRNYLSPNNSARRDEEVASVVCRQATIESVVCSASAPPPEEKASSSLLATDQNRGDNRIESTEWDDSTRFKVSQSNSQKCTMKNDTKQSQSNSNKWDAFASLENNYESSDSSGDESESDSDGSYGSDIEDGYKQQQDDVKVGDKPQWDAFKSLQETLSDDDSSTSGSDEESSDCIMLPDEEDKKMPPTKAATKNNLKSECVDLVDTDDEDDEEVKDKKPKRVKLTRKRNRSSNSKAIALDDSDSSYLSEVESARPLPSSASRQKRSIPPWQLSARSETKSSSILQNDSILPRGSFSCLNGRNDIGGINNEIRTSAPVLAPAAATSRQRKTSAKSGSKRRRKRSNSSTDAAAPAKKKRRTRKYKRSSRRGGRGGRSGAAAASSSRRSNNAWSARERGIRQPIRANNNGSGYMNITKQEPMLQNIGGASIQF